MQNRLRFFFLGFIGLASLGSLAGQQFPGDTLSTGGGGGVLQEIFTGPDTFDVSYFFIENPFEVFSYSDTLLNNYFQLPQPSRHRDFDRINLGNVGTPQQDLVYQPTGTFGLRRAYDIGFHQFDGYRISSDRLPFYIIDDAFTDVAFSQGRRQNDQILTAKFSRNFGKQVNLSLDYSRINHAGVYKNQRSQNSAFSTGIWYHHPNDIYDGYFTITHNSNFQGHNGGIDLSQVTAANSSAEETVPVMLESTVTAVRGTDPDAAAQTRYQSQEVAYAHYFRLRGPSDKPKIKKKKKQDNLPPKPTSILDSIATIVDTIYLDSMVLDSLNRLDTALLSPEVDSMPELPKKIRKPWKREFLIFHKISYTNNWYKFSDEELAADSSFYGDYQVHNLGLRYYVSAKTLENTFRLGTSRLNQVDKEKQKGRFEVGIIHRLTQLEQEPLPMTSINNLFLTGNWDYAPTPQFKLKTYAHYGLWNNVGDYYVSGDLSIDLGKAGIFEAKAIQQHYSPSLVQTRMYISSQLIWERDFRKTFETTLAATYRIPNWQTEIGGQYHLLNNYIYFDTLAQPQQTTAAISIPQLIVKQNFQFGNLHLDNVFAWQLSSVPEVLPLPNLYGKHSLYLEGKIFRKVMLARLGLDLQWNSKYRPNTFQHLFGQFRLQETEELGYYPMVDVYFSMKVKTLKAFVKGENITRFIISDFVYQTPNYPIPYFLIRFGVSWRFLN